MPKRKPVPTRPPIPPAPVTDGAPLSRDKLLPQDLVSQIERSLLAQESYEDFTERLYKKLGIDDTSDSQPSARMRDIDNQIKAEGKVAWNEQVAKVRAERNEALAEANQAKSAKAWWLWRAWRRISRT